MDKRKKQAGKIRQTSKPGKDVAPAAQGEESIFGVQGPDGSLDMLTGESLAGWAWNPSDPAEALTIEVFDGDQLLLRTTANLFRQDLLEQGIGTGRYGFSVPNVAALLPLARHRVAVRRAKDGVDLPGSPQWLLKPEAGMDLSSAQFLQAAATAAASQITWAEDLNEPLALTLSALNALLNRAAALNEAREAASDFRLQELLLEANVSDWIRELIAKTVSDFPPLHFEDVANPDVSIVIPVFNKFQVTYNCLKSILECKPQRTFEVIIVDDCSRDETMFAGFVLSGAIKLIRNAKNQGFVRSCNRGAAEARGKFLFFLNNDTLVKPGWLDELVATLEGVPNVGIAGSKLLFEDGSLQEVGGIIWRLGDGWNWGRQGDPADPKYCFLRDSDYVSGAALMLERGLFERLGGFDELFAPAYYEDADLCFRVRSLGKRVVVQPASLITHLEGVSAGRDVRGSGMKRFQAINHRKFFDRWKDVLAQHRYNGEQPELEAERGVKRRAYFIDETVPTPDQDAGSNAALQHMQALMRLGYKVTFLPSDNMARIDPYTANLQKLGIECLYAPYYWSVEEVFRKAKVKPDLVYLHRYVNASKYASLVKQHFPRCFCVYNVADLHFLRQEREQEIEGSLDESRRVTKDAELAAMTRVDSVIVHSTVEADLLSKMAPDLRVHTIPWTVLPRPTDVSYDQRHGYAFVGGYRHRPNVDAAHYIARDIVPRIARIDSTVQGFLVGSNPPDDLASLESERLKVVGFVPDLTRFLHRLRCTVAPLRYGAGLKGKILESFAHGLPCVMSEIAAEGIPLPQDLHWLVARTPDDIARKVVEIHNNHKLNAELSARGVEFITRGFGADTMEALLGASISRAASS